MWDGGWRATTRIENENAGVRALVERLVEAAGDWTEPLAAVHHVPGRLEILGKHTDYAGGRSLTCAVEQGICLVARRRRERSLWLEELSRGFAGRLALDVGEATDPSRYDDWRRYAAVLVGRLEDRFGRPLSGAEIALVGDLPAAAGMSSSSALMVALFLGLVSIDHGLAAPWPAGDAGTLDLASYLGDVEGGRAPASGAPVHSGVGTRGGSEDHVAILCSRPGELRSYSYDPVTAEESVTLPPELCFAVAVSGVRAPKSGSARAAFNRLAELAGAAAAAWRRESGAKHPHLGAAVRAAGAEVVRSAVERSGRRGFATRELLVRFDQFVEESEVLTPAAVTALRQGDLRRFGALVERSQRLAEEALDNQVPETACLARSARRLGAIASSAFGAGFGGSVWALVESAEAARFLDGWRSAYVEEFPQRAAARFLETRPAAPARRILL